MLHTVECHQLSRFANVSGRSSPVNFTYETFTYRLKSFVRNANTVIGSTNEHFIQLAWRIGSHVLSTDGGIDLSIERQLVLRAVGLGKRPKKVLKDLTNGAKTDLADYRRHFSWLTAILDRAGR